MTLMDTFLKECLDKRIEFTVIGWENILRSRVFSFDAHSMKTVDKTGKVQIWNLDQVSMISRED